MLAPEITRFLKIFIIGSDLLSSVNVPNGHNIIEFMEQLGALVFLRVGRGAIIAAAIQITEG